jgi:hypothetical protein
VTVVVKLVRHLKISHFLLLGMVPRSLGEVILFCGTKGAIPWSRAKTAESGGLQMPMMMTMLDRGRSSMIAKAEKGNLVGGEKEAAEEPKCKVQDNAAPMKWRVAFQGTASGRIIL